MGWSLSKQCTAIYRQRSLLPMMPLMTAATTTTTSTTALPTNGRGRFPARWTPRYISFGKLQPATLLTAGPMWSDPAPVPGRGQSPRPGRSAQCPRWAIRDPAWAPVQTTRPVSVQMHRPRVHGDGRPGAGAAQSVAHKGIVALCMKHSGASHRVHRTRSRCGLFA